MAEPVNAAALLDRLTQCFRSYLSLEPGSSEVLSLWTVPLTLLVPASLPADLPQIARAPLRESYVTLDPRSGHAPPRPSSNITPATVFRVVDAFHPTLLIGEADPFLDNRRELTGILNTGHSRNTAFVERTETVQGVKYARRFSTFAAIGIAAIGNLPQTIEDRATHLLDLARMAIRWVIVNFDVLRESDAMMPDGMSSRAEDNTRTLIAIADIAGDRWEKLSREIIGELMGGSSRALPAEVLLGDIGDIFGTGAATKIFPLS